LAAKGAGPVVVRPDELQTTLHMTHCQHTTLHMMENTELKINLKTQSKDNKMSGIKRIQKKFNIYIIFSEGETKIFETKIFYFSSLYHEWLLDAPPVCTIDTLQIQMAHDDQWV
jgi:hypothetical protein